MENQFKPLKNFEYPGRFIIIGKQENGFYILYGVTARSESARAKRYIYDRSTQTIKVQATDQAVLAKGNLDLLDYNAVRIFQNGIIVGNGKQTDKITSLKTNAVMSLAEHLNDQTFEPDKYQTPRVTGSIFHDQNQTTAALYIISADENLKPIHQAYDLSLQDGQAYFISTYSGQNIRPTPSFNQDPILLDIDFENAEHAAKQVYENFQPEAEQPDLRVSVISIHTNQDLSDKEVCIINYNK
jgi:IMP cyclohydrolase